MKVGELKKMLRQVREKECPPISKMKKAQVIAEIGRVKEDIEVKKVARREKAIKQLRVVEADTKARNVARKEVVAVAPKPVRRKLRVVMAEEDPFDKDPGMVKGSVQAIEKMKKVRDAKK